MAHGSSGTPDSPYAAAAPKGKGSFYAKLCSWRATLLSVLAGVAFFLLTSAPSKSKMAQIVLAYFGLLFSYLEGQMLAFIHI